MKSQFSNLKSKIQNFWILLFACSISGCVYYPQAVDIPLISEKNEARIDAGISTDISTHATVSYGLTDKIAIQGFARYGTEEQFYLQGAAGLYKKSVNNFVTEFYGGFGYGMCDVSYHDHFESLRGNFQLYFLQLNFGKKDRRFAHVDYGIGFKTGLLNTNLVTDNWWNEDNSIVIPPYNVNDQSLVLEPNAVFRIGGKRLKFSIKAGGCFIYKFTRPENKLPYSKWNVGIGLNYHFSD